MFVCVGTGLVCRLEERSAGPPAGRAWAKNKKSSGPRCQRSVPVFSSSTETFWSLSGVFSSLQKNDSLYLEGGRKKLYLKWLLIYINSDPSTFVVLPSTLQTDTRHSQFIGVEFTRFYFEGLFTADPLPDPSCQSATLSGGRPVCCSPCSVMEQVENWFMCWKAAGLELIVVCICS